jgi:hypothetical protein
MSVLSSLLAAYHLRKRSRAKHGGAHDSARLEKTPSLSDGWISDDFLLRAPYRPGACLYLSAVSSESSAIAELIVTASTKNLNLV